MTETEEKIPATFTGTHVYCNHCLQKMLMMNPVGTKIKKTGYLHSTCARSIVRKAIREVPFFGTQGKIALLEAVTSAFKGWAGADLAAKPIVEKILSSEKFMKWLKTDDKIGKKFKEAFEKEIEIDEDYLDNKEG
ncbi:hypothetical protein LCGC14_0195630 [marine sediment metagenome]|uniref:Uncharacterized protein n=1 Tax=marine sediment metagenome TaxID=412755 RepID=A0A0F9UKE5_9ZZZZ